MVLYDWANSGSVGAFIMAGVNSGLRGVSAMVGNGYGIQ